MSISFVAPPVDERIRAALVGAGADKTLSVRVDDDFLRMRGDEPMVRLRWNPARGFAMNLPVDKLREKFDPVGIVRKMREGEKNPTPWSFGVAS